MNRADKAEIVPFGKYKGQPLNKVIRADPRYCKWFVAQATLRDRYPDVYNFIINYGGVPADTPEHNEMQARFLDDDWCLLLAHTLGIDDGRQEAEAKMEDPFYKPALKSGGVKQTTHQETISARKFEDQGWDVTFDVRPLTIELSVDSGPPCTCGDVCNHAADCAPDSVCRGGIKSSNYEDRGRMIWRADGQTVAMYDRFACKHKSCPVPPAPRDTTLRNPFAGEGKTATSQHHKDCVWANEAVVELLARIKESPPSFAKRDVRVLVECKPQMGDDYPEILHGKCRVTRIANRCRAGPIRNRNISMIKRCGDASLSDAASLHR